jgi:hypothetical protein
MMMMLLSNDKRQETVNLTFTGPLVSRKRRRSSPASASAYTFDPDAEEKSRDAALRAIASLASSVDDARRRFKADDNLHPVPLLREAVAPYLAAAPAHDAALRAFFASSC